MEHGIPVNQSRENLKACKYFPQAIHATQTCKTSLCWEDRSAVARQVSVSRFIITFEVLAVQRMMRSTRLEGKIPGSDSAKRREFCFRLIFWRNSLSRK